ncbi:MAG: UDP-N-acetylmuramoyl-L-alanine--D-glutamate ligase [Bacteroidales bacterium]|nr:UDP-N-acetylmuramoyl-L-alanine--D-glutamate ligase [Bacteroidales bacterium]MDD7603283.1 UDP-N-acetylmuramoyl-L-alanine--D-glutamate ligase [Bacteroidales bacterium]MDY5893548.1 UDP-N-acetylmuramoyl-L-alanine--D-glutamate ligase [Candidatus Limisoma sp.]MDY6105222.1 UDP-N-acetylmuramoyl-L-alanine--D-glutamate ligase [Candidatus Limisoma sp.]
MAKIAVLGGGESGVGAAVLAQVKGFDVWLSDMGTIADRYKERLEQYNIAWEEGGHTEQRILDADEIIKSPGIPEDAPLIVKARAKSIPVISEIEFAGRYTDAKMVCITGSNGKTTTTMLTYHILKNAGINVGLAGNVGRSLAYQVATEHHDVYVIELSSFQLDDMFDFKANIAVLLNITPDHLDRYDHKMQNYVNAKFRIIRNQTECDSFIFWEDDPVIAAQLKTLKVESQMLPFSESHEEGACAYTDNGNLTICPKGHEGLTMPVGELSLPGLHNLYNSMAAGLSASLLDIKKEVIRKALADFQAVEHRLEYVDTVDDVVYINDSKATNVNSCWYALESMTTKVVLILGGKDKGNDYSEIEPLVREKVSAIVCMGKDNEKIKDFFAGKVPVIADTHSVEDAVRTSSELAKAGETVLLSPCCASFDLFKSYEDRGRQFKEQVKRIKGNK